MKSEEFDNQVRSLLEGREMQPSPDAWERIASRMDEEAYKKPGTPKFWWVAATVAGMALLLAGMLYRPAQPLETLPLVEQEVTPVQHSLPEEPGEDPAIESQAVPVEQKFTPRENAVAAVPEKQNKIRIQVPATEEAFVQVTEDPVVLPDPMIPSEVLENTALADIASGESQYEDEIDALLADARRQLELQAPESPRQVNAAALLADVEDELDRNFKDKALEAIKRGVVRLRSAVADGN